MESGRIIEKAKKLGINTSSGNSLEQLEEIAMQLGIQDFDPEGDLSILENTLDSELSNSADYSDDNLEQLMDDDGNFNESMESPYSERFGEAEYNAAKDENGAYDKDYYKNKDAELADKVKEAEEEKNNPYKTNKEEQSQEPKDDSLNQNNNTDSNVQNKDNGNNNDSNVQNKENGNNTSETDSKPDNDVNAENKSDKNGDSSKDKDANAGGEKNDGAAPKQKNAFDKAKDNINLAKAQRDRLQNKINGAKAKAHQIMHPGEALKDKAKSMAKQGAKKAGKAAAKATAAAAKKAGSAIIKLVSKNPYVALIAAVVGLTILLILIILMAVSDGEDMGANYYYDTECNFNNTKVIYTPCESNETIEMGIQEFVVGATDYMIGDKIFQNSHSIKALSIALKTKVLSVGNYTSSDQKISIDGCQIGYKKVDETDTDDKISDVSNYTYVSISYKGVIPSLKADNDLEINVDNFDIDGNYESILSAVYKNDSLGLFDISKQCKVYVYGTGNSGFWWPIGSKNVTYGDNIYGGTPTSVKVTSPFGMRWHPVDQKYKMHNGIDIGGGCNQVIIATKNGKVTAALNSCKVGNSNCGSGYGNYVMITHDDGTISVYAHMAESSVVVSYGKEVAQGQKIGLMGTTGKSTGCHLHFEIRNNGSRVNPLDYVSQEETRPVN